MKKIFMSIIVVSLVIFSSFSHVTNVFAKEELTSSYKEAKEKVIIPKYEEDGSKTRQKIGDALNERLDQSDLKINKDDDNQLLEVDVKLKDVYLESLYKNGISQSGESYINFMNYYIDIIQINNVLKNYSNYKVKDNNGNILDSLYMKDLEDLLEEINDLNTKANLQYDLESVYDHPNFKVNTNRGGLDVIAKKGDVTFKFHIDSHGWWGYDLGAHDSFTGEVMGYDKETSNKDQHEITTKYGNYFVIKVKDYNGGTLYMLNGTDLENPMIYVNDDKTEAFMIDVDFYGQNVINKVIKDVIGLKVKKLGIFLTHNHGDHVNNLDVIVNDDYLKSITQIYWPENEPHTILNGKDLVTLFGKEKTLKDQEEFTIANVKFKFNEIADEHTPGGGQLGDLDNKILYSGDTLGAQVHLGGTTVRVNSLDVLDNWEKGALKSNKFIEDHNIKYIIGGHTPYLNTTDFSTWLLTAVRYAKEKIKEDSKWGGLVIVEKGQVVSEERMKEIFAKGLSDREELDVLSVNFVNQLEETQTEVKKEDNKQVDNKKDDKKTKNTSNKKTLKAVKTGDNTHILIYVCLLLLSLVSIYNVKKN